MSSTKHDIQNGENRAAIEDFEDALSKTIGSSLGEEYEFGIKDSSNVIMLFWDDDGLEDFDDIMIDLSKLSEDLVSVEPCEPFDGASWFCHDNDGKDTLLTNSYVNAVKEFFDVENVLDELTVKLHCECPGPVLFTDKDSEFTFVLAHRIPPNR